jgi:glycine cleavage system H protein
MGYPSELKYTKDHEWARANGKVVTVGITDHAQSALGDIVFVELPEPGKTLKAGDSFGVVESIKAVSDLYAPIAGKVTEVNSSAVSEPSMLNRDPHGEAWLIKLEVADPASISSLMDSSAYEKYVKSLS